MSFSLSEIEALSKKAARGAGFGWGMADEAAKATRWLCKHDFDGCQALVNLLELMGGIGGDRVTQPLETLPSDISQWTTECLCPIALGTYLSDRSDLLIDYVNECGGEIKIGRVVEPMLLIFFLSVIARKIGVTVHTHWSDTVVRTDGRTVGMRKKPQASGSGLRIWFSSSTSAPDADLSAKRLQDRANPSTAVMQALDTLAGRTYAPESEQSRQTGAGAGLVDND